MREHKYRGLTARGWVYGDLLHCHFKDGDGIGIKNTTSHINDGSINLIPERIIEGTQGQYTGLKDSDGVEVFESDLCSVHGNIYLIEYSEEDGGYFAKSKTGSAMLGSDWFKIGNGKVIGNRHQNKELLEAV